jgi:hypothetical protein
MKAIIILLSAASIVSCTNGKLNIKPVKLTYTDPTSGLTLSENVGDGVFGLEVDLTQPIDLGGGRTLDFVFVEPAK